MISTPCRNRVDLFYMESLRTVSYDYQAQGRNSGENIGVLDWWSPLLHWTWISCLHGDGHWEKSRASVDTCAHRGSTNWTQSVIKINKQTRQEKNAFGIERRARFEGANWQPSQTSQRLRKMSSEGKLWIWHFEGQRPCPRCSQQCSRHLLQHQGQSRQLITD